MAKPGKHDSEASSSSGPRAADGFTIAPRVTGTRIRLYVKVEVCRRYWDTSTPMAWTNAHLPTNWHMSPDQVPVPAIPATGRARLLEINRRRASLPPDLVDDPRYAVTSSFWDTWFWDEHDVRRQTFFASRASPAPPALGHRVLQALPVRALGHDSVDMRPRRPRHQQIHICP